MIKVLIIEDEQPAASRLQKLLAEVAADFEVIHRCDSIEASVQYFRSGGKPDLIFLDIQLGDGLSFEIFNQVEIQSPVIFTTAYDEYALRAFELNSIDYLLKPIRIENLEKSIAKFRKLAPQYPVAGLNDILGSIMDVPKRNYKQRFLVYAGESLLSVPVSEIAYFYSVEKSTFLTSIAGRSYPVDYSLDKLESLLAPADYFRVNRQYIVSMEAIRKINILSKSRIKLLLTPESPDEVLISNARTHDFRQWLDR